MKNKYDVKIVVSKNNVEKVLNEDEIVWKFVVVTADGLPYKAMIESIKNVHTCGNCGKKIRFLAYITDHFKDSGHNDFFQTYVNILPNICLFHYSLTMLRSLGKLERSIDYGVLVISIHFETSRVVFYARKSHKLS